MNFIHVFIVLAILVAVVGVIYYLNPYFDHTPYERTLLIDHNMEVKGAWGKYYNMVYKEGDEYRNIHIEWSQEGEVMKDALLVHRGEKVFYSTFRLKIVQRCDLQHGCFEVIEKILEDMTKVTQTKNL